MCNSSLGVWKTLCLLSVVLLLFVSFYLIFVFQKKKKKKKKEKRKLCYVFVKFELNCDGDMHFIGVLKGLNISLCQ
jgi:positive regulator of sigma E activity